MIKLPEYMPDNVKFDMKHLYMLSVLMNDHKDGKCSYADVRKAAKLVDSNRARSITVADEFINDDKCVRAVDGDEIYLCSLRKPFGRRLGTFNESELSDFITFRDNLIARTLVKVGRISAKAAASRFGVTDRTIRTIVKKLREEGKIQVVNNFILINSRKCREIDTVKVPDSNMRGIRAANSYYSSDDRDVTGVYADKEYVKYRASHSQGKHEKYYDGTAMWTYLGESGPVDNFKLHSMTRKRSGAIELNKIMNHFDGKRRRK